MWTPPTTLHPYGESRAARLWFRGSQAALHWYRGSRAALRWFSESRAALHWRCGRWLAFLQGERDQALPGGRHDGRLGRFHRPRASQ